MSAVRTGTQTLANGTYYRIKVKGVLEPVWSERLGGLELSSWQGETTLSGYVGDQAALHGLLMQIRDLGLPLLLVQEIDSENHRRKEAKMSDSFRLQPPEFLVSCVIADEVTVDALVASLAQTGYTGDDVVKVLHGEADLQRIDPNGTYHGGFARFMRAFQKFTTGVDERILNAVEVTLTNGQYLVGVLTDGSETQRDEVHHIMQDHGGKRIFFAGRATTQLLSGWEMT